MSHQNWWMSSCSTMKSTCCDFASICTPRSPQRFVVVQSNLTFSGKLKELYAQRILDEAVASDQVRQRRIVLTVPTPPTPAHTPWDRERFQRTFLLKWLQRHYADHWVHLADVDELLDPQAVRQLLLAHDAFTREHLSARASRRDCMSPMLRSFYYGEACPKGLWMRSLLFHTASSFFAAAVRAGVELRFTTSPSRLIHDHCTPSEVLLGWHLSFASDTDGILRKLRGFSHAYDPGVRALLGLPNVTAVIDDRVRHCVDVLGRPTKKKYQGVVHSAFDGKLPWLPGWPRHPLAPR